MSSHHSHRPRARYRDIEKPSSSSSSSEESDIPLPSSYKSKAKRRNWSHKHASGLGNLLALLAVVYMFSKIGLGLDFPFPRPAPAPLPRYIEEGLKQCEIINRPTPHFKPSTHRREKNDRYVEGTRSVWLKNGTLWTGEKGGTEILRGVDVLLEGGVIRRIGSGKDVEGWAREKGEKVEEVQLGGAWVTPGWVL